MRVSGLLFLWALLYSAVSAVKPFEKVWENTEVKKSIDVGKSYVKEKNDVTIKNIYNEPLSQYIFGVPKTVKKDISLIIAIYENLNGKKTILQPKPAPVHDDDLVYYELSLPYPIAPGSDFSFMISMIVTNQMVPYPEMVAMTADQRIKLSTNAYPLSPYDTLEYTLDIFRAPSVVQLSSEEFPIALEKHESGTSVSFKASEVIEGNTMFDLTFTFVKNAPLPFVNYLQRDLWVSHWSNKLQLEEYYEVTNHAAKLDSGFSRGKYLAEGVGMKAHHSISALRIPFDQTKTIQDGSIYYVDKVGNVSTSQFYPEELIIRPRYPLFGGWNYNFTIGWNYDLSQFLRQENNEYILTAHILDGISDTTYDEVSFSVYLPEGAEIIDYALPFNIDAPQVTHEFSYLDVESGHVKITFKFENLIDEMKNLVIILRYRYTTYNMIEKPLKAALYIFMALMGLYVLKKIDLSIKPTKSSDKIEKESEDIESEEQKQENST